MSKVVIHFISNNCWGGGEQYVFDLSKQLISDGIDTIFITNGCSDVDNKLKELRCKIYNTPLKGIVDLHSIWKISNIILSFTDVILHTHNFKDSFTAIMAKKICNHSSCKIITTRHLVRRAKNDFIHKWIYKKIDTIIFVSKLAQETFFNGKIYPYSNTCIIYNSIPKHNTKSNNGNNHNKEYNIILYHGRLSEEKGINTLIQAVSLIPPNRYKLILVGKSNNNYQNELKDLIKRLDIQDNIIFEGFCHDIYSYIRMCDIAVQPSMVPESFGLGCIEVMSEGKPIITTNIGAQKEYIKNRENGLLVNAGNIKELSEAINYLLLNEIERIRIGNNALRDFNKNMSYNIFYDKIKSIYGI